MSAEVLSRPSPPPPRPSSSSAAAADRVAATGEHGLAAALRCAGLQAGWLLRRWSRDPLVLAQTLVFPAFLLLVFRAVLGDSITAATGRDSIYGTVPLTVLVGTAFGALGTGASLITERDQGLLARFHVLPIHRAGGPAGRLLAELARSLAASVVLTLVGLAVGLRFHHGVPAALGFVVVPCVLAVGIAALVTAVAVRARNQASLSLLMLFFNSGFVPAGDYPGWLQPVVRAVPFSPAVETMRALADDGPVLVPFLQTLAWGGGLVVVFGVVALRGYRLAAARRG
ncbi:ABC transporter permease [Candidatus Frankia nodulisporulans]|uniref:ABC transporter permease n=1 Tax=Candidatus Frankia nodulisporulans TaxID=2060052 RepID=UPI0013D7380F|nr:ABC transporter permease [Candidatus Frankia nodulisporulans]